MKYTFYIFFLLLVSCAFGNRQKYKDNKIININSGSSEINYKDRLGKLDLEMFKKLSIVKRINHDCKYSCFRGCRFVSTNYLELSDKEISFYRLQVLKYKMKDYITVYKHSSKKSVAVSKGDITIESQRCLKINENGKLVYIVSEVYP